MSKRLGMSVLLVMLAGSVNAENLFSDSSYVSLAADHRAIAVGDSVTVLIVEDSRAKSAAESEKGTKLGIGIFGSNTDRDEKAKLDFGFSHDKNNSTEREGKLSARISAFIKNIDKRNNVYLEGRQMINVNGKEQMIAINGWVRRDDIMPNNTVLSTRLADAKITYSGFKRENGKRSGKSRSRSLKRVGRN